MKVFSALFVLSFAVAGRAQYQPNCDNKQVIVNLFEWKWTDVAQECERFLAGNYYCGVQVSPPNEHALISPNYPWWQRYQPVSYKLFSRSGTESEFLEMVRRCNRVGVRVYVDAVFNHMAGTGGTGYGNAGSYYDTNNFVFTGVPYGIDNFTPCDRCPWPSCQINETDPRPENWRNCWLYGLADLYTSTEYVRDKVATYLNRLINIGVAGMRVDAAKSLWPADIENILGRLGNLPVDQGFLPGSKFFVFQSVADFGRGTITVEDYYNTGYVTEYRYIPKITDAVRNYLLFDNLIDYNAGMTRSDRAFIFVDNHDSQRNSDFNTTSFKNPREYKQAVAYTLAQDYGFTSIMSSYDFTDNDQGPPNINGSTSDVIVNVDGMCGGGWICEHRWNVMRKMARFRNGVVGTTMAHYWNDGTAVAFARGNRGFFAMARDGFLNQRLQTGLPAGTYCNIVDDCVSSITVTADGTANIRISNPEEPIVAVLV